jgi:TrpR-related protein YerC/YecD
MRELFQALLTLKSSAEVEAFLRDLCTLSELEAMAHRWQVARLLERGLPYLEIAERTGASTTTVTRVAHWLKHGEGGYRLALDRAAS